MMNTRSSLLAARWVRYGCLTIALGLAPGLARAVDRIVRIEAPLMIKAGVRAPATIIASTNAGDKERVGFLHAEVSADGGATWTALCYLDNGGATESRQVTLPAGVAGGTLMVRVRVAFRGGAAGDVDYHGGPIKWEETWGTWVEPPARHLTISVRK